MRYGDVVINYAVMVTNRRPNNIEVTWEPVSDPDLRAVRQAFAMLFRSRRSEITESTAVDLTQPVDPLFF